MSVKKAGGGNPPQPPKPSESKKPEAPKQPALKDSKTVKNNPETIRHAVNSAFGKMPKNAGNKTPNGPPQATLKTPLPQENLVNKGPQSPGGAPNQIPPLPIDPKIPPLPGAPKSSAPPGAPKAPFLPPGAPKIPPLPGAPKAPDGNSKAPIDAKGCDQG